MNRTALLQGAAQLGLALSSPALQAFEEFEAGLYAANEVMNLTRVPQGECHLRHFLDSLLVAPEIEPGATVLDIGTGPGFPAWPLALARPDLSVTALDSSGKMLGFLRRHPLPNLIIVEARAEDWGVRDRFDFVTGRAVAPLALQLELSAASCRIVPRRRPRLPDADSERSDRHLRIPRVPPRAGSAHGRRARVTGHRRRPPPPSVRQSRGHPQAVPPPLGGDARAPARTHAPIAVWPGRQISPPGTMVGKAASLRLFS